MQITESFASNANLSASPYNWGTQSGVTTFAASGGSVSAPTSGERTNFFPNPFDTLDQDIQFQILNAPTSSDFLNLFARLRANGTNYGGYYVGLAYRSGGQRLELWKYEGNSNTATISIAVTYAANDVWKFSIRASGGNAVLSAYRNGSKVTLSGSNGTITASGGDWVDSSPLTGLRGGMYSDASGGSAAWQWDNLVAGDAVVTVELVVADATHGHTVDSPSMTQANTLALAGSAHTHFADAIGLTQAISIAVAECVHGLLVDGVALVQGHMLQVGDSAHLHISEGLELTQANILAIGSAVHAHTADSADMSAADVLSVDSSAHEQTAEGTELVQASILAIGDSAHSLVSAEILLSQSTILAVGEAVHATVSDGVTLSHSAILAVASAVHLHAANEIDLTQAATIVVSDSLHALVSQQVNLLMPGGLGVPPGRTIVVQDQKRVIVVQPESRIYRVH